jgi:hypothetical protein
MFNIPEKFRKNYKSTSQGNSLLKHKIQEIPIELPDGTTPISNYMIVYRGKGLISLNFKMVDLSNMILPPLKDEKNYYFEQVLINLGKSIYFEERKREIFFNSSPQDIMSEIGAPNQIFYKKHNKLKIHSKLDYSDDTKRFDQPNAVDYFYNYFALGIDVMFDGISSSFLT